MRIDVEWQGGFQQAATKRQINGQSFSLMMRIVGGAQDELVPCSEGMMRDVPWFRASRMDHRVQRSMHFTVRSRAWGGE